MDAGQDRTGLVKFWFVHPMGWRAFTLTHPSVFKLFVYKKIRFAEKHEGYAAAAAHLTEAPPKFTEEL